MKTRFLSGLKFLAVLGGATILLGCGNSTTKVMAQNEPDVITQEIAVANSISSSGVVTNTSVAVPENLSPGLPEIIKLSQSNVSEEVLLAYIANSDFTFNPSADEILYLTDLGLSDPVITALVTRKKSDVAATTSVPENVATNVSSEIRSTAPTEIPVAETNVQVAAPAPVQAVTVNNFYESLSPYGNWIQVDNYGLCWQPSVVSVNVDWRPYHDRGRWLYTDCGWYWQSDYSWGWAPFHYGRWYRDYRCGWVWVPDTTWGPSWVSWRYSSDYCGWAPLPPAARYRSGFGFSYYDRNVGVSFEFGLRDDCYTFVPSRHFYDRNPWRYAVSPSHRRAVYNNTTVNNYYVHNKTTVINHGIAPERIASASGTRIEKVAVREMPSKSPGNRMPKPDRVTKSGNSSVVYRPSNPASVPAAISSPQTASNQKVGRFPATKQNVAVQKADLNNLIQGAKSQPNSRHGSPSGTIFTPQIGARTADSASVKETKKEPTLRPSPVIKPAETTKPLPAPVADFFQKSTVKNGAMPKTQAPQISKSLPSPVPQQPAQNKAEANISVPQTVQKPANVARPQKSVDISSTPVPARTPQPIFSQNPGGNFQLRPQRSQPSVSFPSPQPQQQQQASRRTETVATSAPSVQSVAKSQPTSTKAPSLRPSPVPIQSSQPIFKQDSGGNLQAQVPRSSPSVSVGNYPVQQQRPQRIESAPKTQPMARSQSAPVIVPSYKPSPAPVKSSPAPVPAARPQPTQSSRPEARSLPPAVTRSPVGQTLKNLDERNKR